MAFLDNTTVFLDAVLTDLGRQRLAAANGTFRIESFSLSDDEIDYSATNPEDSPIMEALFNNSTANKYNLVSYTDNNLTYLPVIDVATHLQETGTYSGFSGFEGFVLLANQLTIENFIAEGNRSNPSSGILYGNLGTLNLPNPNMIRTEQGLKDEQAVGSLDHTMQDDVYEVCVDSQILKLRDAASGNALTPNYTDDDLIDYYYINGSSAAFQGGSSFDELPQGTSLQFKLMSSQSLLATGFFNDRFSKDYSDGMNNYKYLDTTVKVKGRKTGFVKNIPVRILKAV